MDRFLARSTIVDELELLANQEKARIKTPLGKKQVYLQPIVLPVEETKPIIASSLIDAFREEMIQRIQSFDPAQSASTDAELRLLWLSFQASHKEEI